MIDVGDAENPPNRQLLGSDAYIAIRNAMAERMRMNHILPAMNNSHRFRQRKMIRRAEDQSLRTGCPSSRTTSVSSIDSADRCDYEKGMRKLRTKSATTTVRNLDLRIPFAAGTQARRRACMQIGPIQSASGYELRLSHVAFGIVPRGEVTKE